MSDWFHHAETGLRHAASHLAHHGSTIAGNSVLPQQGATVSLLALANDMKTALEDGETRVRTVLDQHMPAILELAERVESDPLIQAAEAAALPAGAKVIVAEFIAKLAAEFPGHAAAEPAPAEPQPAEGEQAA